MRGRGRFGERGQSLVEFALIAPVLLLLLLGILDGGRVFAAWVVLTNEAREGARYVVVDTGRVGAEVTNYIRARTQGVLDQSALTINSSVAGNPPAVEVSLAYRMTLVTPLIGQFFPNPVVVTARSIMRAE